MSTPATPIEDHALIGDKRTCALVTSNGTIDWFCIPRFDGPAVFCSLLGNPDNGEWRLAPASGVTSSSRRYMGETLVLETDQMDYVTRLFDRHQLLETIRAQLR